MIDFPLFLIKHDTVTINNHALYYTADACFQGNWREKVSIQMEKLRCDSPPFYALSSCNIVQSENTREGPHFFLSFPFIIKYRSSHRWCTLVTMTWLFWTWLFTGNVDGVQSDPDNELVFLALAGSQRALCNAPPCWLGQKVGFIVWGFISVLSSSWPFMYLKSKSKNTAELFFHGIWVPASCWL